MRVRSCATYTEPKYIDGKETAWCSEATSFKHYTYNTPKLPFGEYKQIQKPRFVSFASQWWENVVLLCEKQF